MLENCVIVFEAFREAANPQNTTETVLCHSKSRTPAFVAMRKLSKTSPKMTPHETPKRKQENYKKPSHRPAKTTDPKNVNRKPI